jgi:ketosteroid isomerase-like protein
VSDTSEVVRRFNDAFRYHDPSRLDGLVGEECVMEAIQPAPDGARYVGRAACLEFWRALAGDRSTQFETEDVTVTGDRANILWRYRFGAGEHVRGVTLVRVRDGVIVEALGYSKVPDASAVPLAAETPADGEPRR